MRLMIETPVNYDDRSDPDCPKTAGEAVVNAICFTGCITPARTSGNRWIMVWSANAAEQIEGRLAETGWKLERSRPWKE